MEAATLAPRLMSAVACVQHFDSKVCKSCSDMWTRVPRPEGVPTGNAKGEVGYETMTLELHRKKSLVAEANPD